MVLSKRVLIPVLLANAALAIGLSTHSSHVRTVTHVSTVTQTKVKTVKVPGPTVTVTKTVTVQLPKSCSEMTATAIEIEKLTVGESAALGQLENDFEVLIDYQGSLPSQKVLTKAIQGLWNHQSYFSTAANGMQDQYKLLITQLAKCKSDIGGK